MDKKALISVIHRAGNMSISTEDFSISGTNNLLVLITAAGQITGTPLQVDDKSNLEEQVLNHIFSTVADVFAERDDDSFILLKDAVLNTLSGNISYQYLYVFTDDVIAATIANSNAN